MRAGWLCIAAGVVGLSLAPVAYAEVQPCRPFTPLEVVVSPDVPEDACFPVLNPRPNDRFAMHSWQLFIALNWPAAKGARDTPDGKDPKKIEDRIAPRVWETWKPVQETFIPGGDQPAGWEVPDTHALCRNSSELKPSPTKVLADLNQSGFQGEAIGPLIAQNGTYVRYEIRINRKGFEEIRLKNLYRREKLPPNDGRLELPTGMINIKAAWREVRPGENTDRYYQTEALAFDPSTKRCDKRLFVLIGLHIAQKTPRRKQWIWSTFEHVDNIKVGPNAPPGTTASLNNPNKDQVLGNPTAPVDASHFPPNPKPVQVVVRKEVEPTAIEVAANAKWQESKELKNTVWRFYKLIRTQWPADPERDELGTPEPGKDVVNATMETYRQMSDCIGCHHQTSRRTDFTWYISLRAHQIDPSARSNARIFSDTVLNPLNR